MVHLFAYLVSIEQYADPEWPIVKGADRDTSRTVTYLNKLEVPQENVLVLTGQSATREAIITKFQEHLINNPKIKRGDPILFHFSGHGSRRAAPKGWKVIEEEEEEEEELRRQVEMIIPWDEGVEDRTGRKICGIPDRTIGALLSKVAKLHGDNITVVLDCCHSGHGTRGGNDSATKFFEEYSARGVDPLRTTPLREDIDQNILAEDLSSPKSFRRGGFSQSHGGNHVLMAACGQKESAMGNKNGGLLTTYWLDALQRDIYPRTYAELMKYVDKQLEPLRLKHPQFINQHPQCEGVVRDRLVFEETMMSSDFFPAERRKDLGENIVRIEAGEVQGIQQGTLFELHEMDNRLQSQRTMGSATAIEVNAADCIAEFAEGIVFDGSKCTALVLQHRYHLKYSVDDATQTSPAAKKTLALLRKSLSKTQPNVSSLAEEVPHGEAVDLVIKIDSSGEVILDRRDSFLRTLKTDPPRIQPDEMETANFPYILNAIARFNMHLALTNPKHPLIDNIEFSFHRLEQSGKIEEWDDDDPLLEPAEKIPFVDDEARFVQRDDDRYAFILDNKHPTPLYPYLVYFDPTTYEIATWYTPFEAQKATLPAAQSLQIGASPEHQGSFQFFLPEGAELDTSFIKLVVLDSISKMDFMNQRPVLGMDEDGESIVKKGAQHRAGGQGAQTKGRWDSIIRKLTVTRQ
ncbi:hypothetical protein EW026_g4239 [Hermanssonia centrifuga]|uniref:Peptidase C14 caspase domain-containing protein n=1 Tax=Hermanssonia centrifuga TaxID=98765 RepID=A0A4S4KHQ8_9APHY|nr:hypothetical protein EW026_g4239 [Hermanssonia centrifuga]